MSAPFETWPAAAIAIVDLIPDHAACFREDSAAKDEKRQGSLPAHHHRHCAYVD
jgi:hypothetical protein